MSQTVFPCLTFKDARSSFEWLERALGAERVAIYEDDEGRIVHGEVRVGESAIMASDERAGSTATPPGASVLYVAVDDADAAYVRARDAGADATPPVDMDYGSRELVVTDPDGNRWVLGTYRGAGKEG